MRNLLFVLATVPLLAQTAIAAQPMRLSDQQMDSVTAGNNGLQELLNLLPPAAKAFIEEQIAACGALCLPFLPPPPAAKP